MTKRAVILCGGLGTRLRPYTVVLPKPLMPIGEFPILEVVVRQLASHGFTQITLAVNHQADLIRAFFGDGRKWNISIDYSFEGSPLGTMGPLKMIDSLPENFLVMNGDILTDLNFSDFFEFHIGSMNQFTVSSYERRHQIDYGVLLTNERHELVGFQEKPTESYRVSMGIYMLNKQVVDLIPSGPFGFDDLMAAMIGDGIPVGTRQHDGYWLDIGRPDDYHTAIEEFEALRSSLLND